MFEISIFATFLRVIPTVVDLHRNRTAPFSYMQKKRLKCTIPELTDTI